MHRARASKRSAGAEEGAEGAAGELPAGRAAEEEEEALFKECSTETSCASASKGEA